MCREVGLPPGVLNILTGLGHEAGAPLASHPHVDKVPFSNFFHWQFYKAESSYILYKFGICEILRFS